MELKLVKNEYKYWEFIRNLRNDNNGNGFVDNTYITEQMQSTYMDIHEKSFYIALLKDKPVGFIGVIDGDIRIAVEPEHMGKGIGLYMLEETMKINPTAKAKIKLDNVASLKLFQKAGFKIKYYLLEKEDD